MKQFPKFQPEEFVPEEPPPPRSRGRAVDWCEYLRPLVDTPDKWFRVKTWKSASPATKAATKINDREVPLVLGHWQARHGECEDGRWGLWVRYSETDDDEREAQD